MTLKAFRDMELQGEVVRAGSEEITLSEQLDSGGEGEIYAVENNDSEVVKVFYDDERAGKEEKLRAMIQNEPADPTKDKHGIRSIAWPQEIVREQSSGIGGDSTGEFLGYTMPYIDMEEKVNAGAYAKNQLKWRNSERRERYQTALNLSLMVHNTHKKGHAIGDFNPKNFKIEDKIVTLIDTDAFDIKDGETIYEDTPTHPDYVPPQDRTDPETNVQNMDRFSLAIHIFIFLTGGVHPFDVDGGDDAEGDDFKSQIEENAFPFVDTHGEDVRPKDQHQRKYDKLPETIQELFERCFSKEAKDNKLIELDDNEDERPKPIEWAAALYNELGIDPSLVGITEDTTDGVTTPPDPPSGSKDPEGGTEEESEGDNGPETEDEQETRDLPDAVTLEGSEEENAAATEEGQETRDLPDAVTLEGSEGENAAATEEGQETRDLPDAVTLEGSEEENAAATEEGQEMPDLPDVVSLKYKTDES